MGVREDKQRRAHGGWTRVGRLRTVQGQRLAGTNPPLAAVDGEEDGRLHQTAGTVVLHRFYG